MIHYNTDNILSYFIRNISEGDKKYYSILAKPLSINVYNDININIYYKDQKLYQNISNFSNIIRIIYNYEKNIKKVLNGQSINRLTTYKLHKNKNNNIFCIYYNKDKKIEQNNTNYITRHKYCFNAYSWFFTYNINLIMKYNVIIYNLFIYKFNIKHKLCSFIYKNCFILVPNKYEIYYFSNFFIIYFDRLSYII